METGGMEEDPEEHLETVLEMKVDGEGESEVTLRALEATEFLTQEAEPRGTTLFDACNGFNKMSRLAMMWKVQYRWTVGVRFAFNCYKHWAQLLIHQPREPPVTIVIRKGLTQGDPLSIVLYIITLIPLA